MRAGVYRGADHRNAGAQAEGAQIGMAANDQIGPPVHSQLKELAIGRLAAIAFISAVAVR